MATDLTALRAEAERRTDCDIADARQTRSCDVMWPTDPASWCVGCLIRRLLAALEQKEAAAQKWALHAFTKHGNDAALYNGLADLGGIGPDGEGWRPVPPQEPQP